VYGSIGRALAYQKCESLNLIPSTTKTKKEGKKNYPFRGTKRKKNENEQPVRHMRTSSSELIYAI
jgi:hypothetical protein